MISYEVMFDKKPAYLHAKVVGVRTAENSSRFLKEAYEACVKYGRSKLLLELQFFGPSLDTTSVFRVVSERAADTAKLERVAYVESGAHDPLQARFAETVAANRGVKVTLFPDVNTAARWLLAA